LDPNPFYVVEQSWTFFKFKSKYLDQDLNPDPNIWIMFKIQNPIFIKEI